MLPINLNRVIKGKTENEDSVIENLLPQYLRIILTAMALHLLARVWNKFNIIMCFLLGMQQETGKLPFHMYMILKITLFLDMTPYGQV